MAEPIPNQWVRVPEQENDSVFRWFERWRPEFENFDVVSVVQGYFPDEANVRGSMAGPPYRSFEIRGHKDIVLKKPDSWFKETFDESVRREEMFEHWREKDKAQPKVGKGWHGQRIRHSNARRFGRKL